MGDHNDDDTKSLLRSCAENLLNAVSRLENRPQGQTPSPDQGSTPSVSTPSVSEEHRRLFGYRPPNVSRATSSSTTNGRQSAPKRRMVTSSTGNRISIPVRNTWTRTFVCLMRRDATTAPSTAEKVSMLMSGLEEKSICFEKGGSSDHVHNKILEAFPMLVDAGGYEILRTGERGNRQLMLLSIPPGGYTVAYLKATIASAKGYIRPLQKDLVISSTTTAEQGQMQIPVSPKVSCINCLSQVPMDLMRKHEETCVGGSSATCTLPIYSDSDTESPSGCKKSNASKSSSSPTPSDLNMPGPSTILSSDEKLDQLMEMFPARSISCLRECLAQHGTVASAALSLSASLVAAGDDSGDDRDLEDPVFLPRSTETSLQSLLQQLQKNLSSDKEKLKVDEEDLLNDAMAYYKDESFDPKKKLRIIYKGQPAADTGGVVRQFFTELLDTLSHEFFHGLDYKSPIYNSNVVACGMMKLVGTIIVHSILQGGPGFPVFSPSVYHYLATGDLDAAMGKMTLNDCSARTKHFILQVAEAVDVSEIGQEETTDMLSECGLTVTLTNENKMRVIQSIVIHDVIGRPKIVLDQLRQGLGSLDFGAKMMQYPDLFEELFVHNSDHVLSGSDVTAILNFPVSMSEDETDTHNFLKEFLMDATQDTLKHFLLFATGAPCLPNFGLGRISVKFDNVPSIFASTCLLSLTIPHSVNSKSLFSSLLEAVIDNGGKHSTVFNYHNRPIQLVD